MRLDNRMFNNQIARGGEGQNKIAPGLPGIYHLTNWGCSRGGGAAGPVGRFLLPEEGAAGPAVPKP